MLRKKETINAPQKKWKIRDTVVYGSICKEFGDTQIVHHVEKAAT